MTMTLERTDLEIELFSEDDTEKVCSWQHPMPVEAAAECVCLGCASFCGYACGEHVDYAMKVLDHRIAGKLVCRRCNSVNKFSFIPLGA